MRRIAVFVLTGLVILALSGCADFFTWNLFAGWDRPAMINVSQVDDPATAPTEDVQTIIDQIEEQVDSPTFIDELIKNPQETDDIIAFLEIVSDRPVDSNSTVDEVFLVQEAAYLGAKIELAVSGGDELINNFFGVLLELAGGGDNSPPQEPATDPNDFTALVGRLIPFEFLIDDGNGGQMPDPDQRDRITALFDGLIAADGFFRNLGDALIDTNGDGVLDSSDVSPNINTGAAAQSSLICAILGLVERLFDINSGYSAGDILADLVYERVINVDHGKLRDGVDLTAIDWFAELGLTDDGYIRRIFLAANMGSVLESLDAPVY